MSATVVPWSASAAPTEAEITRRMSAEGLEPSRWESGPRDRYGVHAHPYHKVLYCLRGSIRFTLPGAGPSAGVDLTPGDRLELAAGTPHGAVVGPQGCHCVEAPLRGQR
jgi:quercetin dioxygenase-like cupin family protein